MRAEMRKRLQKLEEERDRELAAKVIIRACWVDPETREPWFWF